MSPGCTNAKRTFQIGRKEQGIILSHLWPLTLFHFPVCRKSWLVGLTDKWCSVEETLKEQKKR